MTDDRTPQEYLDDARDKLAEVRDYSSELWHPKEAAALIEHIAALEAALGESLKLWEMALELICEHRPACISDDLLGPLEDLRRHRVLLSEAP